MLTMIKQCSHYIYYMNKHNKAAGKSTGVITTTRITDASPAGTYGHVAERDWENDAAIKSDGQDSELCDDLPEQLVLREPGKSINVSVF